MGDAFEELKRIADRNVAIFRAPKHRPVVLIENFGIPRTTLANWLTSNEFPDLDASRGHAEGKTRLFSARDVMLLSGVAGLTAIGVPMDLAKDIAKVVVINFESAIASVQMASRSGDKIIWRHKEGTWAVVTCIVLEPPGPLVRDVSVWSRKRGWHEDPDLEPSDIPSAHVVWKVNDFVAQTSEKLGMIIVTPRQRGELSPDGESYLE
jgi:hypothetical protein